MFNPIDGRDLIIKEVPKSFFPVTIPSVVKPNNHLQIGRFSFANEDSLIDLAFIISQNLLHNSEQVYNLIKTKLVRHFIRDPLNFKPVVYEIDEEAKADPIGDLKNGNVVSADGESKRASNCAGSSTIVDSTAGSKNGDGSGGGGLSIAKPKPKASKPNIDNASVNKSIFNTIFGGARVVGAGAGAGAGGEDYGDEEVKSPGGTVYNFPAVGGDQNAKGSYQGGGKVKGKDHNPSAWSPKSSSGLGDIKPNEKIKKSDFKGVPDRTWDLNSKDIEAFDNTCKPVEGELNAHLVGENVVYFSESQSALLENAQFMHSLAKSLPTIISTTEAVRQSIMRSLQIAPNAFTIVNVVVDSTTLAFTFEGGIYLNCKPIADATNLKTLKTHIYFSLIHELTHRSRHGHDTHFASEYGKLVYLTCDCLKSTADDAVEDD